MKYESMLWLIILFPFFLGFLCAALPSIKSALNIMCAGIFIAGATGMAAAAHVLKNGPVFTANKWIFLDALSAYNLFVMLLVYCLSSAYARVYFNNELISKKLTLRQTRIFVCLWCEALSAMSLVLLSNNLGIMWVGIEATTVITSFLICVHISKESLEAMWKYIIICSVGVAFAFLGTLIAAASAKTFALGTHDALLWTSLKDNASRMDPTLIKVAFIFLLVGYGTKAGLAPMHSWLPDAHSQAPAPVSAIFSGFMLNAAMYCIMRYVPIVEAATGNTGWGGKILCEVGIFSIIIAAAFILFQRDLKRFLAYSSIEHLGIIALGVGLGGVGTFAALFHILNHSLGKTVSFFSAGRLGQIFKTHEMEKMAGSMRISPVWGIGIFGGILALIGVAPFSIFMSEFQIVKAAVDTRAFWPLIFFLAGASIVFIGALSHAIPLAWGTPSQNSAPVKATFFEALLVFIPLAILLILGLWMPEPLYVTLNQAANIIQNPSIITAGR